MALSFVTIHSNSGFPSLLKDPGCITLYMSRMGYNVRYATLVQYDVIYGKEELRQFRERVPIDIIRNSPKELLLAGVADLVSNLSALKDWKLAHKNINEPIDELAYMLSKEAVIPLLHYKGEDVIYQDEFLYDLTNAIVTSGLSMIVAGNTRMTSGAEHMISHAIDEYFPEKSTIHGLQVGWAHLIIERDYRKDGDYEKLHQFYDSIGLLKVLDENIPFSDEEFKVLIPYAKQIRNRYTVFNTL